MAGSVLLLGLTPVRAWGQTINVPLGSAARFGLLSGGTLNTTTPIRALGRAGASVGITGDVQADSGLYRPSNQPTITQTALTDLAAARTYCNGLAAQTLTTLAGQVLTAGAYKVVGATTLGGQSAFVALTGDSTSVFVLTVTGDVTLTGGAVELRGDVRPRNIYWNVLGALTAQAASALTGVVMVGGGVSLAGPWAGLGPVLASGSITCTGLDAVVGLNWFPAASNTSFTSVRPGLPPPPALTCNLVPNNSFEAGTPPPAGYSDFRPKYWFNPTGATPDWCRNDGQSPVSVPTNLFNYYGQTSFGGVPGKTGQAYAHILSGAILTNGYLYREYIGTSFAAALQAGKRYYVAFWSHRAIATGHRTPSLGLHLSTVAIRQTTQNALNNGSINPAITAHDVNYTDDAQWSRTAGTYVAQGGETTITIGNFSSSSNDFVSVPVVANPYSSTGWLPEFAGYYIDEVTVQAYPEISSSTCQEGGYTLTATCALPLSSGASYQWVNVTTNQPIGNPSAVPSTPFVAPLSQTTYGLQTTVPGVNSQQAATTYTATIILGPDLSSAGACPLTACRPTPYVTLANASYTSYTFQANTTYYVPNNVRFDAPALSQANYTLPAGSVLLVAGGKTLTLGPRARLVANQATITAACTDMWGGIILEAGSSGASFTGATMSQSTAGIQLANSNIPLTLTGCTFRDNLTDVEILPQTKANNLASTAANSITTTTFSAGSNFKAPNAGYAWANAHLCLGNADVRSWTITGNTFQKAMVGIYGGVRAAYTANGGDNCALNLGGNTFSGCPVGDVVAIAGLTGTIGNPRGVPGQGNTFQVPESVGTPTQLITFMTAYRIPADLQAQPVGLFAKIATGNGVLINGNQFTGATALVGSPSALLGTATGIWLGLGGVSPIGGVADLLNNTFIKLGAGIRVAPLNMDGGSVPVIIPTTVTILNNQFTDCRHGVHLMPNLQSTVLTPVRVSCNDFTRTTTTSATGLSAGIYLEPGAKIEFAWRDANGVVVNTTQPGTPTGSTPGDISKNQFDAYPPQTTSTVKHYYVYSHPSNTYPTYYKTYSAGSGAINTNYATMGGYVTSNIVFSLNSVPFVQAVNACSVEEGSDDGIQHRGVGSTEVLGEEVALSVAPNPATDGVTLHYTLPLAVQGDAIIRESLTGKPVWRGTVAPGQREQAIRLAHLPSGLYRVTLLPAKGKPVSAHLQLTH